LIDVFDSVPMLPDSQSAVTAGLPSIWRKLLIARDDRLATLLSGIRISQATAFAVDYQPL
jgi:hypothetical protein